MVHARHSRHFHHCQPGPASHLGISPHSCDSSNFPLWCVWLVCGPRVQTRTMMPSLPSPWKWIREKRERRDTVLGNGWEESECGEPRLAATLPSSSGSLTGPGTAGTGSQVSAGSHMWPETRGYVTENVEQARPAPPTHSGCYLSNCLMIAC